MIPLFYYWTYVEIQYFLTLNYLGQFIVAPKPIKPLKERTASHDFVNVTSQEGPGAIAPETTHRQADL